MTGENGGVIRRENKQNKQKIEMRYFRNREISVLQKTDPYNSVTINTKILKSVHFILAQSGTSIEFRPLSF